MYPFRNVLAKLVISSVGAAVASGFGSQDKPAGGEGNKQAETAAAQAGDGEKEPQRAESKPLKLGDPAPALKVADWVKGSAVDISAGKGKNVYVVEFWATWCPPCLKSIPHLTELQKKFKDKNVIVIGVSNEPTATVKPFVEQMGEKMEYTVVSDDKNQTAIAYMDAFGIDGIPHAFIVDKDGHIVWHGNPLADPLDESVEAVVAGKFDMNAAKKAEGEKLEMARNREKAKSLFQKYFMLVLESEEAKGAAEVGEEIMKLGAKDALIMTTLAWNILDSDEIKRPDLALALRAASAAIDAGGGTKPEIIDVYARALFENGKLKEAVDQQQKAVDLVKDEDAKKEFTERLETYRKKLAGGG